jgi:hypothetical protein
MIGDACSVVDPYTLDSMAKGTGNSLPMHDLGKQTRHKTKLLKRPSVVAVIDREQNRHFLTN